jgi:hypothetical protein
MRLPSWWEWDFVLTDHVEERMEQRGLSEVAVRAMIGRSRQISPDCEPGRWVVVTSFRRQVWEVILEPDSETHTVAIVTAYQRE